jgi:uncharacterized membrane protein YkvA (DUF1232 family)
VYIHQNSERRNPMQKQPSRLKTLGYSGMIILCVIYLLNPTSGVIELIPDVLPIVGNIDETAVASLLILSIQKLWEGSQAKEL